jgi:sterol desaturase/sphingolipid hydroxylase (fatty acid hydroxylase superfamily)
VADGATFGFDSVQTPAVDWFTIFRMNLFSFEQTKALYRADFSFYGAAVIALSLTLILGAPPGSRKKVAILAGLGLLGWTLLEYVVHRFVLHGVQPCRRWHAAHHSTPKALICAPTILTASTLFVLFFVPIWLLSDLWSACGLTLGLLTGYFGYAVTHHATHHWRAAGPWLKRRQKWHLIHHHAQHACCYGVTSGIWDHAFGSLRRR